MKHGERVRREILRMGVQLWCVDPAKVNSRRVAKELGMTHANVIYHFKSSVGLREAVAQHAVKEGETKVIIQLIASNHKAVAHMSDEEKQKYFNNHIRT